MIRLHAGLNQVREGVHGGGALLCGVLTGAHAVAQNGIEPAVIGMEADATISADSCAAASLCRDTDLYGISLLGGNLHGTELAGIFL